MEADNTQSQSHQEQPRARGPALSPEDVRMCYQSAVQLATYDGQLSWQVTGLFLQFAFLMIAGAVFPSFVGSDDRSVMGIAGMVVSAAGLTMTVMFGSMVRRVRTYEEYWVSCAAQLEPFMSSPVRIMNGMYLLSTQKRVAVGENSTVHMPKVSAIKSKVMLNVLFVLFVVAFLVLFTINVFRLSLPAWVRYIFS